MKSSSSLTADMTTIAVSIFNFNCVKSTVVIHDGIPVGSCLICETKLT